MLEQAFLPGCLDVCCGGRMMWFNKTDTRAMFCDNRKEKHNRGTWHKDLSEGFDECWRVLRPWGTLIFKWSESQVPVREVLSCFRIKPLFGHTTTKHSRTHWMCFLKGE